MIEGFVGFPGAGKTYAAVQLCRRYQRRGRKVFSNVPMTGAYKVTPDDLLERLIPRGSVLLLDEVQTLAPARRDLHVPGMWESVPYEVYIYFSQGRKEGVDLIWTSQDGSRVDKVLREVTQIWTEVEWLFGPDFPLRRQTSYSSMAAQVMGNRGKDRKFFWITRGGEAVYDSFYTVSSPPKDSFPSAELWLWPPRK